MADNNTPRLMQAAKEFNIGKETLVDFLEAKGFSTSDVGPNTKLSEEMYGVLQNEFASDKVAKQKAEQIDLPKGTTVEARKKKDEEIILKKKEPVKKEEPKKVEPEVIAVEIPKVEIKVVDKINLDTEVVVQPVQIIPIDIPVEKEKEKTTKIEAPKVDGPKVIETIDLSLIDSSTRPKKGTKKIEEKKATETPETEAKPKTKTKEVIEEIIPKPIEVVAPVLKEEVITPTIENIQADKLEGPKILGKIELPVDNDTRPKRDPTDKRKRKRVAVDKKPGGFENRPNTNTAASTGTGTKPTVIKAANRTAQQPTAPARPARVLSVIKASDNNLIDGKAIQDKLKQTQALLAGGKGKRLKAKNRRLRREELAEKAGREEGDNKLQVTEYISVSELANLMDVSFAEVIGKCMSLGMMVSINQRLEADIIELVASEFDFEVEFIGVEEQTELQIEEDNDAPEDLKSRAPIVTIMGHVDHGKTSLLDYIRNANVIAGEAGGITQHIGAYEVTLENKKKITFLDTPGHEAFTAMRARGAKVTDIAVIVVAADDAVMPQTREAISHAQAASVPMIFAINKIDKDGANPEKIKEQLSAMNILVEDWGGKFQSQELSAKKGLQIDDLLDKILLEAEMLDLKANPDRNANGTIIEASLDKGRGYVATILVQNGTLKSGDIIVSGQNFGKIKAMYNERNVKIDSAPPATPCLILGLNGAPQAGETFKVYSNESEAKEIAYKRGQILREQGMRAKKHITLDEIGRRLALGNFKELNIIIKGDVDGSVEALSDSLQKLSTEEIVVKVIHKGVGAITESDVTLASASDAIIIGFNVRPSMQANKLAETEAIQIKLYSIIYAAIEEIKSAMEGLLEPTVEEKILANVEIRETYKFDKVTVAGCFVLDGKILRNNKIRIVRDGIVIFTGELGSLKRFKDDVKEVATNYECGLSIKNYANIEVGDIIESFEQIEVKRSL